MRALRVQSKEAVIHWGSDAGQIDNVRGAHISNWKNPKDEKKKRREDRALDEEKIRKKLERKFRARPAKSKML